MPMELYALGRLAVLAGVDLGSLVRTFLWASGAAAVMAIGLYLLAPPDFFITVMDLPRFIREVQGFSGAVGLREISLLVRYGPDLQGEVIRAVGPFTHPVGAGHYFVVPLLLAVTAAFREAAGNRPRRYLLTDIGLILLFAAAVLTSISRGAWAVAAVGTLICGISYRRLPVTIVGLALASAFVLLVQPFSSAATSAVALTDPSSVGHVEAIGEGWQVVLRNLLGLGVGQADHPGTAFGGEAGSGVGENMYLSLFVSVGPLGLLAFLAWLTGLGLGLVPLPGQPRDWVRIALFSALVAFLVSAATAAPLMRFTTAASFWLLVGMALIPDRRDVWPTLRHELARMPRSIMARVSR